MKLVYKSLLIWSICITHVHSSEIYIYITLSSQDKVAKKIKTYFNQSYSIPNQLITIKLKDSCKSLDNRFLEICFDKNKELVSLTKENKEEIFQSLLVFSQTEGGYNAN